MKQIHLVHAAGYFPESEKCPPLGLLYLASYLRRAEPCEIRVTEMQLDYRDASPVLEEIAAFRPDLVGISAMTAYARQLHELVGRVKAWNPGGRSWWAAHTPLPTPMT